MRYDAEHKSRTRAQLLREATRAVRRDGPHGLSVQKLMASAGLTHGGFYAHFASKDDLLVEAIEGAFADGAALFARATEGRPPREALRRYVESYLSERHRAGRDSGCPLPALGGDVGRLEGPLRNGFAVGVARLTGRLAGLIEAAGLEAPEATAAASVLSEMVGALSLSRALPDGDQASELLRQSRAGVLKRLGLEEPA